METKDVRTDFLWGNRSEIDHLEELAVWDYHIKKNLQEIYWSFGRD